MPSSTDGRARRSPSITSTLSIPSSQVRPSLLSRARLCSMVITCPLPPYRTPVARRRRCRGSSPPNTESAGRPGRGGRGADLLGGGAAFAADPRLALSPGRSGTSNRALSGRGSSRRRNRFVTSEILGGSPEALSTKSVRASRRRASAWPSADVSRSQARAAPRASAGEGSSSQPVVHLEELLLFDPPVVAPASRQAAQ